MAFARQRASSGARPLARTAATAFLALALAFASGAASDELDCPRGTDPRGAAPPEGLKQWCEREDGTQHGPSVFFYPEGGRRAEAQFRDGALDGRYREWHPNGQLALEGSYDRDLRDGGFTLYDEAGHKRSYEEYRRGVQHGKAQVWWPNGRLMLDAAYVDGKRHGPAVTYFENGRKQTEGVFEHGEFDGKWTGWYEDGSLQKIAVFEEGREISREFFPRGDGG
jgi:antitoxin component YwqK of YwqJK toxin-antitoxin module